MTKKKPSPKSLPTKKPVAKKTAAKPAAKKTVAKKVAAKAVPKKTQAPRHAGAEAGLLDGAPATSTQRQYTLLQLQARLTQKPAVTDAEVWSQVLVSRPELTENGARVGTERIDADAARLYGAAIDFMLLAPLARRQQVRGCSLRTLQLGVYAALRGSALWAARQGSTHATRTEVAQNQRLADTARQRGVGLRNQLLVILRQVSGGAAAEQGPLEGAYGGGSYADLPAALRRLAAIGQQQLKRAPKDPALLQRCQEAGLDAAYLADIEQQAQLVADTTAADSAPRPRNEVSQAEVDLWDGVNLYLLDGVCRAFEAAHLLDPLVPRLLPVALRSALRPQAAKRTAPDKTKTPPKKPTLPPAAPSSPSEGAGN